MKSPRTSAAFAGAAVAAIATIARPCVADPQASIGLTVGAVVQNAAGAGKPEGAFHFGGRADVLFLRDRGNQMAIGPYVDAATASLRDVDLGGGLEWLLPVRDDLPVVLAAGLVARDGEGRTWAPGLEGTVFFGSRSYNYHSWYGLTFGLFAQTRWIPSPPATADFIFGVQIDGEFLAMPSMLIFSSFKSP